ncbi:MAG: energy transducer TonB [Flavobacteriia bacterium]|jgi:TonB family protein
MKNSFFLLLILCVKTISAQTNCSSIAPNYTGFCAEKHPNGKTSWLKEYQNGKAVGTWMYFNEKGEMTKQLNTSLKRDSLDKLIVEETKVQVVDDSWVDASYNEIVEVQQQDEVLTFVEEAPTFNGDIQSFFKKNIIYPNDAKENGIEGKVYAKFVIEKDGSISNIMILRSIPDCTSCDKEAKRVIKLMPKWNPGKNNGVSVRTYMQIPISFNLK